MIEIIPHGTIIDFLKYRRVTAIVSIVLIVLGMAFVAIRGINFGIDFAGGSLVHVRFAKETDTDAVRAAVSDSALASVDIQKLGGGGDEYLVRVPGTSDGHEDVTKQITSNLATAFGADGVEILRVESVGPRVGESLRERAILAVAFATLMMGIYIWARFEWRFGIGAGVALAHDVLLTTAALVVFGYEFDLTIVAALLSVVGYSVNDTVVISDRIRENMARDRRANMHELVNRSINETLSRTILTTGTTLFVVLALYLLGGTVINGFAFTLLVGFIVGTYSTVFIAGSVVLYFEERYPAAGRKVA